MKLNSKLELPLTTKPKYVPLSKPKPKPKPNPLAVDCCALIMLCLIFGAISFAVWNFVALMRSPRLSKEDIYYFCCGICKHDTPLEEIGTGCQVELVESIPEGLTYNSSVTTLRTHDAWNRLLDKAEHTIEIASSYWSLRGQDTNSSNELAKEGERIFNRLVEAAQTRGIKIKIAQNLPDQRMPSLDTIELAKLDNVEVKSLNFTHLVGAGILHTKMWLIDRKHFYVGSANLDWRSLTQVKEMGVVVSGCPTLAEDMGKIFDIYWQLGGKNKTVPCRWPAELDTTINDCTPLKIPGSNVSVYLSSSPASFTPCYRTKDFQSIIAAIERAEKFVHVAVMDYFPITIYSKDTTTFWPQIDDALRKAAIQNGVEVRILLSNWTQTRPSMTKYLKSMTDLTQPEKNISLEGRFFKVPSDDDQAKIPFARVNHNKYVVTDKEAVIGTSNWSADYFLYTGGIGFWMSPFDVDNDQTAHGHLVQVFKRDWESAYASKNV